jgi:hypothetical protein
MISAKGEMYILDRLGRTQAEPVRRAPAGDATQDKTPWITPPVGLFPGPTPAPAVEAPRNLDGSIDGVAHVKAVLAEIRDLKRRDPARRAVVVFDLDNTIFETRARTLHVLQELDRRQGTSWFDGMELSAVGKDGRHSAALAGVPSEHHQAIQDFWLQEFWKGENFLLDLVFEPVRKLAWEAKAAGAEVVYLTGRVNQPSTLEQLIAARLPDADAEHLFCKPTVGTKTAAFKAELLGSWIDRGDYLGWFMTEGRRDIASVQALDARVPCVRLGYVHEREGEAVHPDTPFIPESWTALDRARPCRPSWYIGEV